MKKILAGALLIGLLAFMAVPFVASAQVVSPGGDTSGLGNQCCKVKHDISAIAGENITISKGSVVAPDANAVCSVGAITKKTSNWAAYCLIDSINTISDWIFWIAFIIGGVVIVVGGIMFMTAGGNPERTNGAKTTLTMGIIGIVVAILARFIPGLARFFLGM